MTKADITDEEHAFLETPGMRYSYMMIRNCQLHSLEGRRAAITRTLQEVENRFDADGRLGPQDATLWVHAVADVMMLFSDLAAVTFAARGPLAEFGKNLSRITSSQARRIFQQIVNKDPSADSERLWNMGGLVEGAKRSGMVSDAELDVIQKSIDQTMEATDKSLRAIARLYLRHEKLMHQVKHAPWKILSHLQEDTKGHQVVAAILNDELWEREGNGALPLPVSVPMWRLWAFAAEEANILIQAALNNFQFRIEVCDSFVPPVTICTPDVELKKAYIEVANKLVTAVRRGNISMNMKLTFNVIDGGWMDDQEHLWDRLAAQNWPLD